MAAPGLVSTYGGSPIRFAAALAVLVVIEKENPCERAVQVGDSIVIRLNLIQSNFANKISNIRNQKAMIALEMVHGPEE